MRSTRALIYAALALCALSLDPKPAVASAARVAPASLEVLELGERLFKRIGSIMDIATKLVALYETYKSINFSDEALLARFEPYFAAHQRLGRVRGPNPFDGRPLTRGVFEGKRFKCFSHRRFQRKKLSFRYFIESEMMFNEDLAKSIDMINIVVGQENPFFFDYMVNLQYKVYEKSSFVVEKDEVCLTLKDYKITKVNQITKDPSTALIYEDIDSNRRLSINEEVCYRLKRVSKYSFFVLNRNGNPTMYCRHAPDFTTTREK